MAFYYFGFYLIQIAFEYPPLTISFEELNNAIKIIVNAIDETK